MVRQETKEWEDNNNKNNNKLKVLTAHRVESSSPKIGVVLDQSTRSVLRHSKIVDRSEPHGWHTYLGVGWLPIRCITSSCQKSRVVRQRAFQTREPQPTNQNLLTVWTCPRALFLRIEPSTALRICWRLLGCSLPLLLLLLLLLFVNPAAAAVVFVLTDSC